MSTKELVERLRAHTEVVDMYGTLRAVDVCLDAADTIERLERERDEARAEVARYWTSADMRPWVELAEQKGLGHFGKKLLGMFNRAMRAEDEARTAEAEEATLRARVERLEDILRRLQPEWHHTIGCASSKRLHDLNAEMLAALTEEQP